MSTQATDHYVIAFMADWRISNPPVYGPFTREDALDYLARWEPIPGWEMKVVQVIA